MARILSRHRAFIARGLAVALLMLTVLLAIPLAQPNFADDPPPEDYTVTQSDDLDGDDQTDTVIALPSGESGTGEEPGRVEVVSSSSTGGTVTLTGRRDGDWFGASAAVAGDLNGDGFRDLIVGAPRELYGRAYVFHGPFRDYENPHLNVDDAAMSFYSPDAQDYDFGERVGALSDINNDSAPDLRIRAWYDDELGDPQPTTYILSGDDGAPLFAIYGDDPFDPWQQVIGDADGDADVDENDAAIVQTNQGLSGPDLTPADGDLNADGFVNADDAVLVQLHFSDNHFEPFHPGGMIPANGHVETRNFHVTEGGPFGDDDGDGIPNINDPDSPEYYPFHRCSRPMGDCDGDGIPNYRDPDWWFFHFRGDCTAPTPTDPNSPPIPELYPDPDSPNNPLGPNWDKCHPLSDPDRDGLRNNVDHDDDGDGIPDEYDPDPYYPCQLTHDCPGPQPPTPQPPSPGPGPPPICWVVIRLWNWIMWGFGGGVEFSWWLPDYVDSKMGVFTVEGDSNHPACQWAWSSGGVAGVVQHQNNPTLADVTIAGPGAGHVDLECVCDYSWAFKAVDLTWELDAPDIASPYPDQPPLKLIWANDDDDDLDGVADHLDPDIEVDQPELRPLTLGGLVGAAPTEFQNRRWSVWHSNAVKVWFKISEGNILADAWPQEIPTPEIKEIGGEVYHLLPTPQWISGNPPINRILYLEGIVPSYDSGLYYGFHGEYIHSVTNLQNDFGIWRRIGLITAAIDLDIDSDNNDGFNTPDRSQVEEAAEGSPLGKLVGLNNDNTDEDAVPDLADGFDLDNDLGTDDDVCEVDRFVPLIIKIEPGISLADVPILIEYNASDPSEVSINGSRFEPAEGCIRIWTKDADAARNMNSVSAPSAPGDYVPPGEHMLEALGVQINTINLFVETVAIEEDLAQLITIEVPDAVHDIVRVRPFDMECIVFDEETQTTEAASSVAGPSDLDPDLTINVEDVHLGADGQVAIEISGNVKDRLSELADDPAQRLQSVRFYINGELNGVLGNLPALSPESGLMPWQPNLLDVDFSTTLVVDADLGYVRPGGYVVEAITVPNAAGRTARDTVFVCVQWQAIEDLFQAPIGGDTGLTITFPFAPLDTVADWAWVYFGNRDPLPTDGQVYELPNEPAGLKFVGSLLLQNGSEAAEVPCAIEIDGPADFTPTQPDSFNATITYEFEGGQSYSVVATWLETTPSSLRFLQTAPVAPNALQVGETYFIPTVALQTDVNLGPEGPNGSLERTLVRLTGLGEENVPQGWLESGWIQGLVNGFATPVRPFTYSPTKHYFVDEEQTNRPRIFVVTIHQLPPGINAIVPDDQLISNDVIGELQHAVRIGNHDPGKTITREYFEDDFGTPAVIGEPPAAPITTPVLLTYFQLLYSDTGLQLLQFFQNAGGVILLEDQGWFEGEVEAGWPAPDPMRIEIEETVNPVVAAGYLWSALRDCLKYTPMQQQIGYEEDDIQYWLEQIKVRTQAAAGITVAATNLYIAGIAVANEPTDWVLTINELMSEDRSWTAVIGFLPYATASLPLIGKVVVKSQVGTVLAQFPTPLANAVQQASQAPATMAARFPLVQAAGATPQQMRSLVKARLIPVPTDRRLLRKTMLDQGGPPPAALQTPEAHHEFSWALRERFSAWGFDVNDPQYGKWVEGAPHGHHQGWSAAWNQEWEGFLNYLDTYDPDIATGRSMVLGKLQDMRAGYAPGGPYQVP